MIDKSDLEDYVNRVDKFKGKHPNLDQPNTKAKIIEPLLDILEWDKYSEDVVIDYKLNVGAEHYKVDYVLQVNNNPQILVVVKALGKEINDQETNKLIKYSKKEKCKWLIMTNGEVLEVYKPENGISKDQAQSKVITISNLPQYRKTLNNLTKESVKNLEDKREVKEVKNQKSKTGIKDAQKELTSQISELIKDRVPEDQHKKVERSTDAFIKNLIKKVEVNTSRSTGSRISSNKNITRLLKVMPPRERENAKDLLREIKDLGDIKFVLPSGKAWDKEYKWISLEVENPGGREKRIGYIKTMNYGFFVQIQRPERNRYEVGRADKYSDVKEEVLERVKEGYDLLI